MFPAMNYSRIAITIRKPEISAETGVNIEAQTETADDPCMRQPGRGTKDGPIPTFLANHECQRLPDDPLAVDVRQHRWAI